MTWSFVRSSLSVPGAWHAAASPEASAIAPGTLHVTITLSGLWKTSAPQPLCRSSTQDRDSAIARFTATRCPRLARSSMALLVPQRIDRVELARPPRGVDAEDDSDGGREGDRDEDDQRR